MKRTWKSLLRSDVKTWSEYYRVEAPKILILFLKFPEFRVLVKMRLKYGEQANSSVLLKVLRILVALSCRWHNCFIYTEPSVIGKGLLLHHAFATIISASRIGDYCHIYQQVTIGNGGAGTPTIGNNVTIYAGAKVFGKITIGDDVVIGANAVVTKDVPSHSMVAGVPAKIIKVRDSINDQWSKV